jgi:hypothetical protein
MKIVNKLIECKPLTVDSGFIPIGTVFSGRLSEPDDIGVFLRTYGGLVNLQYPRNTWTVTDGVRGPVVLDYQQYDAEVVLNRVIAPTILDKRQEEF